VNDLITSAFCHGKSRRIVAQGLGNVCCKEFIFEVTAMAYDFDATTALLPHHQGGAWQGAPLSCMLLCNIGRKMKRVLRALALATAIGCVLPACDMVNTVKQMVEQAQDAAKEIEGATGVRPEISFHYANGTLELVTLTFPQPVAMPATELELLAHRVVQKHIGADPKKLVIAYSSKKDA
jgi:hypothetical protein